MTFITHKNRGRAGQAVVDAFNAVDITDETVRIFRVLDSEIRSRFKCILYQGVSGLMFPTLGAIKASDAPLSEYPEQRSFVMESPEIPIRWLVRRSPTMEEAALRLAFGFWESVLPEHNALVIRETAHVHEAPPHPDSTPRVCSMRFGLGEIKVQEE